MRCQVISFLCVFLVCLISLGDNSIAGESASVTAQWREVFVTTASHTMSPEGIEGRRFGVMQQRGMAFYQDGTVSRLDAWLTYESDYGNTKYRGLVLYTFPDGATQAADFEGEGAAVGRQKGTFTFINGTGRFEGIKGGGTFTAVGVSREADLYVDVKAKYTVPES